MSKINPTHYEKIPTFADPDSEKYLLHAIIETPRDTRHKFSFDPEFGIFKLRTTIAEGLQWPYDYGFVPQTLGEDGDPLDVLFLDDEPTFAGCLVQGRLVGIIHLEKNGDENDRLLTCAPRLDSVAQRTDHFNDIDDIPKELVRNMVKFLVEYPGDNDKVVYKGVDSRKKALRAVENGIKMWKKRQKKRGS